MEERIIGFEESCKVLSDACGEVETGGLRVIVQGQYDGVGVVERVIEERGDHFLALGTQRAGSWAGPNSADSALTQRQQRVKKLAISYLLSK